MFFKKKNKSADTEKYEKPRRYPNGIGGYTPIGTVDRNNPPKGGSGVPPKK
jgi:hypothetical protein